MTTALFAGCSPAVIVIEGVNFARSEKADTLALVSVSPLTTSTEIGTFCRFSERFSAVTTISASCGPSSANAASEALRHTVRKPIPQRDRRFMDFIDYYSPRFKSRSPGLRFRRDLRGGKLYWPGHFINCSKSHLPSYSAGASLGPVLHCAGGPGF